jgi:hypothetical protein
MFGRKDHCVGFYNHQNKLRGSSYEDVYGADKANIIKDKLSLSLSGDKNPMYGKPAPFGAGGGFSGWYKDWYFRSIFELSFMINYIEKNNKNWISAESKQFSINYIFKFKNRNYFCDFVFPDDHMIVEIKPRSLATIQQNVVKFEAASVWALENGYIFKVFTETDFSLLSQKEIDYLVDNKIVILNDISYKKYITKYRGEIKNGI